MTISSIEEIGAYDYGRCDGLSHDKRLNVPNT
jgi:hypothetical protein